MNIDLAYDSTRRNEAISLTVATGLHLLMFLWNPILLKSDFKQITDFVSVEVVESAGSPMLQEKPKMSMLDTLKDMLLTPKSDALSHTAPVAEPRQVAAPQPTLKEATRKPMTMDFKPQSQNEDLAALKNPEAIKAPGARQPTLPVGGPTLESKSFGGIRAKDIPFQVNGQESIASGQTSNIPIAVGNNSAKDSLAYTGPSLKESSNRRIGLVPGKSGTNAPNDTMALATSAPAPIGTGGSGTAPTGVNAAPTLQQRSGGLVNRGLFGGGRGSGVGAGVEGMPGAAQALDTQLNQTGASSKSAKGKGFEIAGPLTNRGISRKVIPEYPAWAEEQGIMGSVRLYFTVDAAGNVRSYIRVTKTTGYPALDQLGIEALKQWKFVPLNNGEEEKGQWGIITFNFSLSS
jgi:TonB family protein